MIFSRLKLHAQKCVLKDDDEFQDRVIEQFIAGVKYTEVQKELLGKDKTLTVQQTLDLVARRTTGKTYAVPLAQMIGSNRTDPGPENVIGRTLVARPAFLPECNRRLI